MKTILNEGIAKGEALKLIAQVCKKIQKGKSVPEIADDLEEDEGVIRKIYEIAESAVPQFAAEAILAKLDMSEIH